MLAMHDPPMNSVIKKKAKAALQDGNKKIRTKATQV